jgi:hypothetical protein
MRQNPIIYFTVTVLYIAVRMGVALGRKKSKRRNRGARPC